MPVVEGQQMHGRLRHDRCVAGAVLDQRHLADHRPRPDRGDVLAVDVHPSLALDDHVALLAHPALVDEQGPGLGFDLVGELRNSLQLVIAEAIEERDPRSFGSAHGLFPVTEHGRDSTTFVRTPREENSRCEQP